MNKQVLLHFFCRSMIFLRTHWVLCTTSFFRVARSEMWVSFSMTVIIVLFWCRRVDSCICNRWMLLAVQLTDLFTSLMWFPLSTLTCKTPMDKLLEEEYLYTTHTSFNCSFLVTVKVIIWKKKKIAIFNVSFQRLVKWWISFMISKRTRCWKLAKFQGASFLLGQSESPVGFLSSLILKQLNKI